MFDDGYKRLDKALAALGFSEDQPSHHRSNLLHAIQLFAVGNRDAGLEQACEEMLYEIRAMNAESHK